MKRDRTVAESQSLQGRDVAAVVKWRQLLPTTASATDLISQIQAFDVFLSAQPHKGLSVTISFEFTSSAAAGFSRHGMPPPASNPDLWPFDLEIGVRVASKLRNLHSKFGYGRPLGSQIIHCVHDGWTDGQKLRLLPSSLQSGIIIYL